MLKLPTVILEHLTRSGRHFDWLLADPNDPQGMLWTARTLVPVSAWMTARQWMIDPIQPHRRVYLNYQGPLTGSRGRVIQRSRGWFAPRLWTAHRMVIDLHLPQCTGQVCIQQQGTLGWRASLTAGKQSDIDPDDFHDIF